MNLADLIRVGVKASIVITVFAVGLKASTQDAIYLFKRPGLLVRSVLSMSIVMPMFVAVLVSAFNFLHPAVKIALGALSVGPVPPVLPKKVRKAGGTGSYTIGLLVAAGLFAIVLVPLTVHVFGIIFGISRGISPGEVAMVVLITILAPLAAGIAVRAMAPAFADRIVKPVALTATILLAAGAVPILFTSYPAIESLIGNGTLVALVVFVVIGLAAGHLLGGPDPDNRTVLALSTASRHPGVALAIAHAAFPEQKLALAAVLLYLLVCAVVSIPYLTWTRRRHAAAAGVV
jgi:BASS family bile acid:Na+ symporter